MSPVRSRRRALPILAAVLAIATAACAPAPSWPPPDPPNSPTGCNGADVLCGRTYDSVAYVTTHNAMSSVADNFLGPNQTDSLTTQLDRGVRGFMLDVHRNDDSSIPTPDVPGGAVLLCHEYCGLGHLDLVAALTGMREWLDAHPREVVTLILENYVPASSLQAAMDASGLTPRLVDHTVGAPWPTLGEMVDADRRVVVMTDRGGGAYPWLLPVFSEAWDTNWSATTTSDLTCSVNRGSASNRLVILNNFLTNPIASTVLADQANADPFLSSRIAECRAEWGGRIPNFVTVDFYERGVVTAVVRALNGV
ncbi:MAG: hypothetical protein R2698_14845 [Microthrixaceae bacterium]